MEHHPVETLLQIEKTNYLERLGHFWAMFRFHLWVQLTLLGGTLVIAVIASSLPGFPGLGFLLGGVLSIFTSRFAAIGMVGLYHTQMDVMSVIAKLEDVAGYYDSAVMSSKASWAGEPVGNLDHLAERQKLGRQSSQDFVRERVEGGRYARILRRTFLGFTAVGAMYLLYGVILLMI